MPATPHSRRLHRRTFLAGAGATGLAAVGAAAALHFRSDSSDSADSSDSSGDASSIPTLSAGDLQLVVGDASHPGRVTVTTADARELVHFDGYRFGDSMSTVEPTVDTPDPTTVTVTYAPGDGYDAASVTYRAFGGTVTADWEFALPEGTGEDGVLDDGRIWRTFVDASTPTGIHVPATRWTRDARGGVPYLETVTGHHYVDWPAENSGTEARICGVLTADGSRTRNSTSLQAPAVRGDDGIWRSTVTFRSDADVDAARVLTESGRMLLAGGVLGHIGLPDPLVDVHGPTTFSVLTDGGVHPVTVGLAGTPGTGTDVDVLVRDVDGVEVHRSTHRIDIPADARYGEVIVDVDVPGPRSWYCVDVSCAASFARTTIAVWQEHDFGPANGSIIGLGGFISMPAPGRTQDQGMESAEDEHALWERLGIRHLRNPWLTADESRDLGIRTAVQPGGNPGQFTDPDGQSFDDWMTETLTQVRDSGAEHIELLNEWNANDESKNEELATEYTETWLKPFRAAMDRDGTDADLIGMALAGWDAHFLDVIRDRGGWELLDGIAEHAGRGNYTADYDGGHWNFHGQLRRTRAYLDGNPGPTQLWLTEAYACTQPNNWWNDSPRVAADATMLTLLIAAALGVEGVHWYQLTDGVWHNKYGVAPENPEYHYGLFHVDRSPKLSAVAFAHAAEVLDGADFLGWIESPHPDLRGLRFSRDGRVHWVLWSRQDGYITNATRTDEGFFPFPEPWEDTPGSSGKTLQVGVPSGALCQDVFGREITAENGRTISVGGSPVVVTGDLDDGPGPTDVTGDASIALTGVSVRRDGSSLVIDGTNDTDADLTLRVLGRQVDGEVVEKEVTAPTGRFSETVDLGASMPEDAVGASTSVAVTTWERPQVRILAERSAELTPGAAQPQVWRAEYYRSV
ncbi:hypothetical protein [Corynebacterium terpenotabidum]|uniref:Uncharacterized protein n=1 Tax=Corynebacterium terpenotabidum Y-11 TaxID=1200352 RepID=S4XBF7_9CORY|nr:hypothetical protein [Corynebacterium terpenotabidum]AGP29926.1 hypothetical protein A606_01355 [Corynebacterium terpenotabidum Y-11]